jgi:PKD repeat protein
VAVWDWGDGSESNGMVSYSDSALSVVGSHTYTKPGVYTIKLTVTDDDGGSGESFFHYVVVYNPMGSFITGGGWFDSPPGAYASDSSLTGRAYFGFVARYDRASLFPVGQTSFFFGAAEISFRSSWQLVFGNTVMLRGSGTINGAGAYAFMLTATDGQASGGAGADTVRIKIWDKSTGAIVYDSQMGTSDSVDPTTIIRGGSIIVHKN